MSKSSLEVLVLFLCSCTVVANPTYPPCADGLMCRPIFANEMLFDCALIQPEKSTALVYMMHGHDGDLSKGMFFDLMLKLGDQGFSCLACDQRGYSPSAAPENPQAYHYDILVDDMYKIINSSGLLPESGKFHVVAHDQGARVAWHALGLGEARQRYLSFSSLSIPHSDVFTNALIGSNADADQQQHAQYLRMLVLPNSTSAYNNAIRDNVCTKYFVENATVCQRHLWWYSGAVTSGALGLPPLGPYGPIATTIGIPPDALANLTQYPLSGVPQYVMVGYIYEFPVLYACGVSDTADVCKTLFRDESAKRISSLQYLQMAAPCGHNVLGCSDANQVAQLHEDIIDNIMSVHTKE
eukprot:m.149840 g.149840  ORF g.149840 m.149840 type:complete len:354 (+) comp15019_c3_seq3:80-1141(+)